MLQRLLTTTSIQPLISLRHFATAIIQRVTNFNTVSDADLRVFKDILGGDTNVITDPHNLAPFNTDWMGKYTGESTVALKPRSTEQISNLLTHCSARNLAVVPQGGNTGLVGGSVPVFDEVIISTAAMNKIQSFDDVSGVAVVQAGCILESLDKYLAPKGYTVPLDLGAKGSCHIGGNVATNAGGLRLLRYGSLHGSVLGLEVVLPNGEVLDTLTTLRKDNTGYDLKQLFIGSEGTLGIITGISLLCPPRPTSIQVAYLSTPTFTTAQHTLMLAKQKLGETLSAFEFVDSASLDLVLKYLPGARNTLGGGGGGTNDSTTTSTSITEEQNEQNNQNQNRRFGLVVEVSGSNIDHDTAKLESFLESAMTLNYVKDGVVAQDDSQAAAIWKVREGVTEALRHRGAIYKYDVSMKVCEMYELVEEMRERLEGIFPGMMLPQSDSVDSIDSSIDSRQNNNKTKIDGGSSSGSRVSNNDNSRREADIQVVGYGHMGDGNLHLNISAPRYHPLLLAAIEPFIYQWISERRGSISAEHGIGVMKANVMHYSKSSVAIDVMRQIKAVFDPKGIMNPYKVLPPPV